MKRKVDISNKPLGLELLGKPAKVEITRKTVAKDGETLGNLLSQQHATTSYVRIWLRDHTIDNEETFSRLWQVASGIMAKSGVKDNTIAKRRSRVRKALGLKPERVRKAAKPDKAAITRTLNGLIAKGVTVKELQAAIIELG